MSGTFEAKINSEGKHGVMDKQDLLHTLIVNHNLIMVVVL